VAGVLIWLLFAPDLELLTKTHIIPAGKKTPQPIPKILQHSTLGWHPTTFHPAKTSADHPLPHPHGFRHPKPILRVRDKICAA
jgi:hypothetical protein